MSKFIAALRLRRLAVLTVVVMVLVGSAGGASSLGGTSAEAQRSGTLRIATVVEPLSFDPYLRALQNYQMIKVIYEPLVEVDARGNRRPALATSWSFRRDFRGVDVTLRRNVRFHSGAPFNAAAVVANYQRARNPATGATVFFFTRIIKDVTVVGPYKVRFEFTRRTPVPLVMDTLQAIPMIDPPFFTQLARSASGTGPYRLDSWVPGQAITMSPNTRWWRGGGAPYVGRVQFVKFSDSSAALAALQSNAVEMVYDVEPARVGSLRSRGYNVLAGPPGALNLEIRLNPRRAPFTNGTYRRVMNYAIDRTGISRIIRANYGGPIVTPWYTHDPAYERKLLTAYRYNLDRFRAGVQAAGVSNPDFAIMLTTAFPDTIAVAQIIQAALRSAGVDVRLEQVDSATYTRRLLAGDYQATVSVGGGGSRYPSSITFNSAWRVVDNPLWGASLPQEYINAVGANERALSKSRQAATLRQLQAAGLKMASVLLISDRPILLAANRRVRGFAFTVDSMPLVGGVRVAG